MSFVIPKPIKPFNQQFQIFPSVTFREPTEGKRIIPLEFDWDGNGTTLDVNIAGQTNATFSQIVTMDVDNTSAAADVTFFFPDTGDTLTVPAYEAGTFPVFTSQLRFYASAPAALATDVTRVRVLNYRMEPIANPGPQFHSAVASGIINPVTGTTAILSPATAGTLIGYSVQAGLLAGAALGQLTIELQDTVKNVDIDVAVVELGPNQASNGIIMSASGFNYRFAGGIQAKLTAAGGAFAGGAITASLKFRSP